jgi:hypothetical protein
MSNETAAQITSIIIGVVATIAWRLIDRYLPDPRGTHPLPPRPGAHPFLPVDEPPEPPAPPHETE